MRVGRARKVLRYVLQSNAAFLFRSCRSDLIGVMPDHHRAMRDCAEPAELEKSAALTFLARLGPGRDAIAVDLALSRSTSSDAWRQCVWRPLREASSVS